MLCRPPRKPFTASDLRLAPYPSQSAGRTYGRIRYFLIFSNPTQFCTSIQGAYMAIQHPFITPKMSVICWPQYISDRQNIFTTHEVHHPLIHPPSTIHWSTDPPSIHPSIHRYPWISIRPSDHRHRAIGPLDHRAIGCSWERRREGKKRGGGDYYGNYKFPFLIY